MLVLLFVFYAAVRKRFSHGLFILVVLVHFQNFGREPFQLFFSIDSYIYKYFFSFWVFYEYVCMKSNSGIYATETTNQRCFKNSYKFSVSWNSNATPIFVTMKTPRKTAGAMCFSNSDLCSNISQRINVS